MKTIKNNSGLLILVLLVVAIAFLRMFIPFPNVTPVAAIALFSAAYFKRKEVAMILPITILLISDVFIGFYSPLLMAGVYGSFILIALIGFVLRRKINFATVVGGSLASSVIFFLVTNFVVWLEGLWYPLTGQGLMMCYYSALPFFRYEVFGTLAFTSVFFGSWALINRYSVVPQKA